MGRDPLTGPMGRELSGGRFQNSSLHSWLYSHLHSSGSVHPNAFSTPEEPRHDAILDCGVHSIVHDLGSNGTPGPHE